MRLEQIAVTPARARELQRRLLRWYRRYGRHNLPWRKQPTPYRVLVAEVMLQQTQVSRVAPKYRAFLRRYPSFRALARAGTRELLALWSGLGYNRRALLLRECARCVVREYGGRLPTEERTLRALPGIGPYTARAINVFARNRDEVCVDTNVRRVLTHELKLPLTLRPRALEAAAQRLLPRGRSRQWHNALMDYGASVATSRVVGLRPRMRQGRFLGSSRYYRGQALKLVLRQRILTVGQLARALGLTSHQGEGIVASLVHDGLVARHGRSVTVPRGSG
jgi:A/G-specific adenine glycosylase